MKKEFYHLEVWQKARTITTTIYSLTKQFPKEETFGLTNQIRRATVSIPSNIAEGIGRNTAKDTLQFLYIARGSLYEVETQLLISRDLNYISEEELNRVKQDILTSKKLLNGFINYYKRL